MFKNVASQKIQIFAFDTTTGAPKTGDAANITAYVSKDHGAVTALGDTSATEMDATNAKGVYVFDLTQGETNADEITFTAKSSTANISITPRFVSTVPAKFTALVIDSAGLVDANAVKVGPTGAGTAQTARDIGASVLLSAGTGAGQLDFTSGVVKANVTLIEGADATDQIRDAVVSDATRFAGASIAAIKTTTDKVDDTLEDDGSGTFRLTHDALAKVGAALIDVDTGLGHFDAPPGSFMFGIKRGVPWSMFNEDNVSAYGDAIPLSPVYEIIAGVTAAGSGFGLDAASVRTALGMAAADLDTQLAGIDSAIGALPAPLSASGTRAALGLASANLDTQLGAIGTEVLALPVPLTASGVRSALGLASANLDTQLDALPTSAELATALAAADDATLAAIGALPAPLTAAGVRTALGMAAADLDTQLDVIAASADAADARGDRVVIRGTVGSTAPGATSFTPSVLSVPGVDTDQLKGRIIVFDRATTTTALRGQATNITASSADTLPLLTFSALSRAPVAGDTFTIA